MSVKYPEVEVELSDKNENAYAILARVKTALHEGGACRCSIEDFLKEATSSDYEHLLNVVRAYVKVI